MGRWRFSNGQRLVLVGCAVWIAAIAYPDEADRILAGFKQRWAEQRERATRSAPEAKPAAPPAVVPAPIKTPAVVVVAEPPAGLTGMSTGADYARATMDERQDWVVSIARIALPNASALDQAVLAVKVSRCLNVALGVRPASGDAPRRGKRPSEQDKALAAAALVTLAEASAACVILTE